MPQWSDNLFLILLCFSFSNANVYINITQLTTKVGFVLPNFFLNKPDDFVIEGQDVIFRLVKLPKKVDECLLTTQDTSYTINLKANGVSDRFSYWSPNSKNNECGARIKKVTVGDSGRWRLKAIDKNTNKIYQSFFNLRVKKNPQIKNPIINMQDGVFNAFNMTDNADYCEVVSPALQDDFNIYDKCSFKIDTVKKLYGGTWVAKVGLLGKMDEIVLKPTVIVQEENFDVGYTRSNSKINLYCNWKNPKAPMKFSFCRFSRNSDKVGYNLQEGISNGVYSYYGNGIVYGDCGMTIEKTSSKDFGVWKCSIGYYIDTHYKVKESIISVKNVKRRSLRSVQDYKKSDDILGGVGSPLVVTCNADFRLKYCVLHHPNGSFYAMNDAVNNSWHSKSHLDIGECKMVIKQALKNDSGIWKCQLGAYEESDMDITKPVIVRVGDTGLVAVDQSISVDEGASLTIKCIAVTEDKMLTYCRFSMPDGNGFHVNEDITKESAIDDLYWYNGSGLDKGDCQVTINKVSSKHFGKWVCASNIRDYKNGEAFDNIEVNPTEQMSIASISGITIGAALVLLIAIGGFVYYRRRNNKTSADISSQHSDSSESQIFTREIVPPATIREERELEESAAVQEEIQMHDISPDQSSESTPQEVMSTV